MKHKQTIEKVKTAMLAIQRYSWEQGVCAQALYEAGDTTAFIAMAHDAVLRQAPDGRLAVTGENIAVTDPAANGEVVWRAYQLTGNTMYKDAAERLVEYYMERAPRISYPIGKPTTRNPMIKNLICHNEISFTEGFSPHQIWVDSIYMLPPFLAIMGEFAEAQNQLRGYLDCLTDPTTGLLYHIYDAGTGRFVRKKLWATGNGWALLGLARILALLRENLQDYKNQEQAQQLLYYRTDMIVSQLNAMLKYQLPDGMFCDILDEPDTFHDGTSAMMTAAVIYRGIAEDWLSRDEYVQRADLVFDNMQGKIDEFGIIRGVCGCPHFNTQGTSAEAQAAYIMMSAWRDKAKLV